MTVQPATQAEGQQGAPGGRADHWTVAEHTPPAKERCRDCVIAGEHLPRARPAVPIHPWNPRL